MEENRPRRGVRTSNPGGAASRSLVGSTPILFRQPRGARDDGEGRAAVLSQFATVARAVFGALDAEPDGEGESTEAALANFEGWYAQSHARPFWFLFEHYIPETPLVDF